MSGFLQRAKKFITKSISVIWNFNPVPKSCRSLCKRKRLAHITYRRLIYHIKRITWIGRCKIRLQKHKMKLKIEKYIGIGLINLIGMISSLRRTIEHVKHRAIVI